MGWIIGFLKKHWRIDLFNSAWLACSEYPGFRKLQKIYSALEKWTGFVNRKAGKILLPCLAVALKKSEPGQTRDFRMALKCVRNFVDFTLLCHFRLHTDRTIGTCTDICKLFTMPRIFFSSSGHVRKERLRQPRWEVWCGQNYLIFMSPPGSRYPRSSKSSGNRCIER